MNEKSRRIRRWTWAHRVTAGVFLLLLILGGFEWFGWVKGSITATRFAGYLRLADPLATLEVTLAARRIETSLVLAAGVLVILYFFLGRVFCGWICPLGLVLDLNDGLRRSAGRLLGRLGWRLPAGRLPGATKYFLLGLALGVSLIAQLPAFQVVSPINILTWGVIFRPGPEWVLLAGIVILEWFVPRTWCRALCPLGAMYSLIGRFAPLRVRITPAAAGRLACRQCTVNCPMGIAVMEDYVRPGKPSVDDPECTRCGGCLDACPQGSLKLRVRNMSKAEASAACSNPACEAAAQQTSEPSG